MNTTDWKEFDEFIKNLAYDELFPVIDELAANTDIKIDNLNSKLTKNIVCGAQPKSRTNIAPLITDITSACNMSNNRLAYARPSGIFVKNKYNDNGSLNQGLGTLRIVVSGNVLAMCYAQFTDSIAGILYTNPEQGNRIYLKLDSSLDTGQGIIVTTQAANSICFFGSQTKIPGGSEQAYIAYSNQNDGNKMYIKEYYTAGNGTPIMADAVGRISNMQYGRIMFEHVTSGEIRYLKFRANLGADNGTSIVDGNPVNKPVYNSFNDTIIYNTPLSGRVGVWQTKIGYQVASEHISDVQPTGDMFSDGNNLFFILSGALYAKKINYLF